MNKGLFTCIAWVMIANHAGAQKPPQSQKPPKPGYAPSPYQQPQYVQPQQQYAQPQYAQPQYAQPQPYQQTPGAYQARERFEPREYSNHLQGGLFLNLEGGTRGAILGGYGAWQGFYHINWGELDPVMGSLSFGGKVAVGEFLNRLYFNVSIPVGGRIAFGSSDLAVEFSAHWLPGLIITERVTEFTAIGYQASVSMRFGFLTVGPAWTEQQVQNNFWIHDITLMLGFDTI